MNESRGKSTNQAAAQSKLSADRLFQPHDWYWLAPIFVGAAAFLGIFVVDIAANFGWFSQSQKALPQKLLLLIIAIAYLSFIFVGLYTMIQRKLKTGRFIASKEEYAEARARWRNPRQLRARILTACLFGLIATMITIWADGIARHHPAGCDCLTSYHRFVCMGGLGWFAALSLWASAIISTWQIFRPSKGAVPALPNEPQTQQRETP